MIDDDDPTPSPPEPLPAPLVPTPDGAPLTFAVPCRPSREPAATNPNDPTQPASAQHPVTLHADWTLTTPHNMAAERVAAAFGSTPSCLVLVDEVIPAARRALPLLRREELPLVTPDTLRGTWRVPAKCRRQPCNLRASFPTAAPAAAHLRGATHLAGRAGVPRDLLLPVLSAIAAAWGAGGSLPPSPAAARAAAAIQGDGHAPSPDTKRALAELWQAGLAPAEVARLADVARAAGVAEPLPAAYFLWLAYGGAPGPDQAWRERWVATALAGRPDATTAAWLARLADANNPSDPTLWAWALRLGLSRREVETAAAHALDAAHADQLATALGTAPLAAVRTYLAWLATSCRPTTADLARLRELEPAARPPNSATLDRLVADPAVARLQLPRGDLGLLLAALGSVPAARRVVVGKIRTLRDLAAARNQPATLPAS